jgi:hypothetical protein
MNASLGLSLNFLNPDFRSHQQQVFSVNEWLSFTKLADGEVSLHLLISVFCLEDNFCHNQVCFLNTAAMVSIVILGKGLVPGLSQFLAF